MTPRQALAAVLGLIVGVPLGLLGASVPAIGWPIAAFLIALTVGAWAGAAFHGRARREPERGAS